MTRRCCRGATSRQRDSHQTCVIESPLYQIIYLIYNFLSSGNLLQFTSSKPYDPNRHITSDAS